MSVTQAGGEASERAAGLARAGRSGFILRARPRAALSLDRQVWVVAHRWAGLTIALFTLVAGLTGAIIPWQTELQRVLAPQRFVAAPAPGAHRLPWPELRRIAEARSGGVVEYLPLDHEPGAAAVLSVAARPGARPLGFDEIVLDPYTGREIERSRAADLREGPAQVVPFLYRLHYSLALGVWGEWLFGVAALLWTVDCFVGFYLTLPVSRRGWWKSWRVRWRASAYKINFDLHRAGGLWVWPVLLVFAWSSVGMNLRPVYDPVMRAVSDYKVEAPPPTSTVTGPMRLDWDAALATGRRLAAAETAARGLHIQRERILYVQKASRTYTYAVRTERDRSDRGANSAVTFSGDTGRLLRVDLPTGEHAGNTVDYWLNQLHVAGVFGLPYRIFVSAFGVFVAVITVTGVVVWMKKRSARLLSRRRRGEVVGDRSRAGERTPVAAAP